MPNGHGGTPKWGLPLILLGGTVASLIWYSKVHAVWSAAASLVFAALLAWRFSYHVTMWDAGEYGGAYTAEAAMKLARKRHRMWSILGCVIARGDDRSIRARWRAAAANERQARRRPLN